MENETQEYKEKKNLLELQMEADELRHRFKMEELEFMRSTEKLNHEQILERGRISRAEERKMIAERKGGWR